METFKPWKLIMNDTICTSRELSQKIAESKLARKGKTYSFDLWCLCHISHKGKESYEWFLRDISYIEKWGKDLKKYYPAYDILNDICVRFAKEFFGGTFGQRTTITRMILSYIQEGKKEEAEDYIWENCLFNPNNTAK